MYSLWSKVKTYSAPETVLLPLKEASGEAKPPGSPKLARDNVPEVRDNSMFWNHPLLEKGQLQDMYEEASTTVSLSKLVRDNIPEVRKGSWFWNHPLLGNGHLQTMYAAVGDFNNVNRIYYGRRLLKWEDGSTISVDYVIDPPATKQEWDEAVKYAPEEDLPKYPPRTRYLTPEETRKFEDPNETRPLLVTLHGLTGGSHESYVRCTIDAILKGNNGSESDFQCLVLTSRGCNRTKITTPQLFCGVMTEDIRQLVNRIKKTQPNRKVYLVGYSLGASILGNYLGQEGEDIKVDGACCVGNPWDMHQSSLALHSSLIGKYVYSPAMAQNCLRLVTHHADVLSNNPVFVKAKSQPPPKYLYDFDNMYTAPFFGFDSAADYYRLAGSVNRLTSVRTPTLILNAVDDPVVSGLGIPYTEVSRNPYTYLVTTDVGGHLGWFQMGGKRWFANVISQYFRALDANVSDFREARATMDLPPRKWNVDKHIL